MRNLILSSCITLMTLLSSVSPGHAQNKEPCNDKITIETVSVEYPGRLSIPKERTYQNPAQYRHSYIFKESFEESYFSQSFRVSQNINWAFRDGDAKNGRTFLTYAKSLKNITEQQLIQETNNWMVLGPFDLSAAEEAIFNLYIRLGNAENYQTGSLFLLVSINGSAFHGYKYSGTTCNWYLRGFDLSNVPDLGDVCGEQNVWFAFIPSDRTSGTGEAISVDYLRLLTVNQALPPKYIIPQKGPSQATASCEELLHYYSPYIIQEVDGISYGAAFGDYIACFHYDGDSLSNNNWDNLGIDCEGYGCGMAAPGCHQARPLPAYVYGSVIETATDYYLCYAIFHPADDYYRVASFLAHHENDLEGMIVKVIKDGSHYGNLQMVQIQAHFDYYQYVPIWFDPPEDHGIYDTSVEDVDGYIYTYIVPNEGAHPVVYIEGGGHGIHARPGDIFHARIYPPYIHYVYSGTPQEVMEPHLFNTDEENPYAVDDWQRVGYDIIHISAEFWQNRREYCPSGCIFDHPGSINLQRFDILDVGTLFDGNTCMCAEICGAAAAPWWWEDDDDAGQQFMGHGEWFLDPAHYHLYQFNWDFLPSQNYTYNTFLYNQLCGEIYGGLRYFDSPEYPYWAICDVIVPSNRNGLEIGPNVQIKFTTGTKLIAYSPLIANGSNNTIRFQSGQYQDIAIKINCQLHLQNGGSIKIY